MNYETILYQVSERIAVITLNRPERLNAWTPEMGSELVDAMERASRDKLVRVIILTGEGKGFCAGMDVKNLSKTNENRNRNRRTELSSDVPVASNRDDFKGLFNYFPSIGKPVVAAINGPVAGSGLVLALSCDIRIASEDAFLTSSFARMGLVAEHGIAWLLTHLSSLSHALDLLLSGRKVYAREAHAMGIVNFVCPSGEALKEAKKYAQEIAENCSPSSLSIIKRQVWDTAFEGLEESTNAANDEMLRSFEGLDFKESIAAKAQSRKPVFNDI